MLCSVSLSNVILQFKLNDHVVAATDDLRTNLRTITDHSRTKDFHRRSDCYNEPMYHAPITD